MCAWLFVNFLTQPFDVFFESSQARQQLGKKLVI